MPGVLELYFLYLAVRSFCNSAQGYILQFIAMGEQIAMATIASEKLSGICAAVMGLNS